MGLYGTFIKAMQEKYAGISGGQGLDGVPLTAVAPSGLMGRGNGERQITVPSGQGAGSGMRFMGRSDQMVRQANKPAGIVEEDEMVIEAPMVDRMGGPKQAREGIEVLADMKKEGVARSFKTGTGDQTAGEAGTIGDDGKWIDHTKESLGLQDAPTFKTADEVTSGMQRPDSEYAGTTKEAMDNLRKLSTGGSEAMKTIGDVATRGLAGTQAARSSALAQNLAQQGVEGGAARVAQAMENRQAGTEQAKLRSDLAIENQSRMERATEALVNAGFRGQELENVIYQVDVGIKQWGEEYERLTTQWGADFEQRNTQFVQNVNQWGKSYALDVEKHDYTKVTNNINAAFAAGDFDTVSELYEGLGVNIDMTRLTDKQTRDDVNSAMDDYYTYGVDQGYDSPQAQGALDRAYKLQHPEQYDENGNLKPEFKDAHDKYLSDTTERTKIKTSKTRSAVAEIMPRNADGTLTIKGKENVQLFMATMNIPDISKFSFNGETGVEAAIDFYTAWIEIDGFAESLSDPESPASQAISSAREVTDGVTDPKSYSTADLLEKWNIPPEYQQDAIRQFGLNDPDNKSFVDDQGKTWIRDNNGNWKQESIQSSTVETQAGYDLVTGDPMGSIADQILKQGRTSKNSVAYDAIVKSRVENMFEKNDFSSLSKMKSSDPIYKAVLQKTSKIPMTSTYKEDKDGFNREIYEIELPRGARPGSPLNIEGKLYTLSKRLPDNVIDQKWPKPNKLEARYEVIDPTTGNKKIIRAGSDLKVIWE